MVNINGNITESKSISFNNRGYRYGDALFETIKVVSGKILFWEDHYFRLMASMRILRMEIPMNFTMEFLEKQILETIKSNNSLNSSSKVRILIHRNEGGLYLPKSNDIGYLIISDELKNKSYVINKEDYIIDLFKDYYITPGLLSTLKTNNKILNVVGSIYAKENDLDNCLILNTNKQVVEALNGNIFLLKDNVLKTPPLKDGCLNGIMRKQVMAVVKSIPDVQLLESSVSPFEIQKSDEIFLTNVIQGIQPITKYRKKTFGQDFAEKILNKINEKISIY